MQSAHSKNALLMLEYMSGILSRTKFLDLLVYIHQFIQSPRRDDDYKKLYASLDKCANDDIFNEVLADLKSELLYVMETKPQRIAFNAAMDAMYKIVVFKQEGTNANPAPEDRKELGYSDIWMVFESEYYINNNRIANRITKMDDYRRQQLNNRHSNMWFYKKVYNECLSDIQKEGFQHYFNGVYHWIQFESKLPKDKADQIEIFIQEREEKNESAISSLRKTYAILNGNERALLSKHFPHTCKWLALELKMQLPESKIAIVNHIFKDKDIEDEADRKQMMADIQKSRALSLTTTQCQVLTTAYPKYFEGQAFAAPVKRVRMKTPAASGFSIFSDGEPQIIKYRKIEAEREKEAYDAATILMGIHSAKL